MKEKTKNNLFPIPDQVIKVTKILENKGFEAYLIGGCVRDLLLGIKPKDWDITTNAKPEAIISLFPKTFYENDYGTVGIVDEETSDETIKVIEVTPYRLEAKYSNSRHPDSVLFSSKLEDDLKRRDFTINAIALKIEGKSEEKYKGQIVDLYKGQNDIKEKTLRTVGDPEERLNEDALRMLRAVRISTELGFTINQDTEKAIRNKAYLLKNISEERIRDEFSRIILSERPMAGLVLANKLSILGYISPEIEKGIGIEQNQAHSYDVWEHSLRSLQHAADKKWPLHIRLAALFHDVSKPETRRWSAEKKEWTFYGHDVVGAKVAAKILSRLKFPKNTIDDVSVMIRWHMFFSDTEQITLSSVRRLLRNVGVDLIWDLMNLRICDRVGTGRPKENPYRLRKYKSMVEEVLRDPISVGMLKVDGNRIMAITKANPSPKIGFILHALLEEVLDDPTLNTEDQLEKIVLQLNKLSDIELKKIGEKGKQKKEEEEEKDIKEIRDKYWVK